MSDGIQEGEAPLLPEMLQELGKPAAKATWIDVLRETLERAAETLEKVAQSGTGEQSGSAKSEAAVSRDDRRGALRLQGAMGSYGCHQDVLPLAG
jgi:hypothetical protein